MSIKFVPFYFPQFHEIPENNEWWGDKYTDWDRVRLAQPLNDNHHQPRKPLNGDYYDQSEINTLENQIKLALQFNIHGFNFYHYWFDGKLLLEKPINIFKSIDHNLNYCITWANESWTRRWVGKINDVLIKQNHKNDIEEWGAHFDYLNTFFSDIRYMTINNKPVFCIYRPELIENIRDFIDFFNDRAIKEGYQGIYFVGINAYEVDFNKSHKYFDAILRFQPRAIFNSDFKNANKLSLNIEKVVRGMPESIQIFLGEVIHKLQGSKSYSYDAFWKYLLINVDKDLKQDREILQSVVVDWDNTARYGNKAKYFEGVTPNKFSFYMRELVNLIKQYPDKEQIVFINAWNEWSEGAYLEPDEKNGFSYLEALKKLI
jgi:lipopolysaccharide biosynthesis protein